MTIRWVKYCDDFYPQMKALTEAMEKAGFTPTKPIGFCAWCGKPITVEGEPEPGQAAKILAFEPKAN